MNANASSNKIKQVEASIPSKAVGSFDPNAKTEQDTGHNPDRRAETRGSVANKSRSKPMFEQMNTTSADNQKPNDHPRAAQGAQPCEKISNHISPTPPNINHHLFVSRPAENKQDIHLHLPPLIGSSDRNESFVCPKSRRSLRRSLKYGTTTVFWLLAHSMILGLIPSITAFVIFGSTWMLDINYHVVLIYYTITTSVLITLTYICVYYILLYLYGKEKCRPLFYSITFPSIVIHLTVFITRMVLNQPYLSAIYYAIFVLYCCLLLQKIKKEGEKTPNATTENQSRFQMLASDGTPIALIKGLVPAVMAYYVIIKFMIPYILRSNIFVRLGGRLVVLPLFFNAADSYQNNLIIYKSIDLIKYRMVVGNFINFIFQTILRLLVTNSPSLTETLVLSVSSGFIEVAMRWSYIPRTIYLKMIWECMSQTKTFLCLNRNKIDNFSSIDQGAMQDRPGTSEKAPESHTIRSQKISNVESGALIQDSPNLVGSNLNHGAGFLSFKNIISNLDKEHEKTRHLINFHSHRSHFVSVCEFQLVFFIPLTLFLYWPVHEFLIFQTFSTASQAFFSLLIQLPIEIATQIICISFDNYFYGIELPVERSIKQVLKAPLVTRLTLIYMSAFYLATNPFWIASEEWEH